jgi:endonuclease/exonuclease/phosphatase family metal-dependent hydrolase
MEFHFHPAMTIEEERYGDAILSRLPMRLVHAGALPGSPSDRRAETRGALWVEVDVEGKAVQVTNTHLGLGRRERLGQIDALLGSEWLGHPNCTEPAILCGDFNAPVRSEAYRRLARRVRDAQAVVPSHRRRGTWFSDYPLLSIDHVFFKGKVDVAAVEVVSTSTARLASDHLPLVVDLILPVADASVDEHGRGTVHHAL